MGSRPISTASTQHLDNDQQKMNTALQATGVLLPSLSVLAYLVNREVPRPYLDEIFHIPQAQQYCSGKFMKWDPSITTPPGLYILSTALSWAVHQTCDPGFLRYTNVLLAATVLPWSIIGILKATFRHVVLLEVLAISCFPLVTFFSLLYYTDVGSTAFVILGYWAAQEKRYAWSAVAGLVSLLFRQTNVVWIAFTAATAILSEYADERSFRDSRDARSQPLLEISSARELVDAFVMVPTRILMRPRRAISILACYLPTLLSFAAFIVWNGGIVLGHQEMHVATLHFPQVLYFLAFASILGWPVLLSEGVKALAEGTAKVGLGSIWRVVISALVLGAMNLMVAHYTIEHPFLLADNRHYFFYIWRRTFKLHPLVKFLLTPGYLICGWAWLWKIARTKDLYWVLGYLASTALVLVPTPLVEPRYFLVPYMLLRINSSHQLRTRDNRWILKEILWNILVNGVTIGVFLTVTFDWPGWEGPMRFMW